MITPELFSDQEVGELEDSLIGDKCRFCGCDDRPFVENEGMTLIDSVECNYWAQGPFRVHCDKCGNNGPAKRSPFQAIKAWNRMPIKPRKTKGVAKKEVTIVDVKECDEGKKWVIKCPIAVNECGAFIFGYVKAIVPHGRAEEVFDDNVGNAIHFNSMDKANEAAERLDLPAYKVEKNIACLQDEMREVSGVSD